MLQGYVYGTDEDCVNAKALFPPKIRQSLTLPSNSLENLANVSAPQDGSNRDLGPAAVGPSCFWLSHGMEHLQLILGQGILGQHIPAPAPRNLLQLSQAPAVVQVCAWAWPPSMETLAL